MATTIDERVVQMRFDNKQFEAGAQQSISTLDKFKKSLDFTGIASKANSELNSMGDIVQIVKIQFDALSVVAVSALNRITNAAMTAGSQMLKSLTVEPVGQGFSEYELKLNSVQTIMNSTGKSLEEVNGYLDELNTYADKTIYSFSDMTSNIGKFTNAGVDLEKAVKAIQGVSNEAALSGANANEASRAMYNFAQALSSGSVRLIDWKSIENANMATVEFKNELIKTAVELGTVVQQGDKFVSATTDLNGHVSDAFTATSMFNDSLSAQWMTTDVLVETLGRYADETTEVGRRAFAAAQDVKTFSQLMDTLKESVGSGWAQTFEIIFGNFEEAKQLWTGVSQVVGGFIDAQADARNKFLKGWKDLGGRTVLLEGLSAAFRNLSEVIEALSEGFKRIFPPVTAQQLYNATVAFKELVSGLKLSEGAIFTLREAFKALLLPIQVVIQVGRIAIAVIRNLIPIIWNLIDSVLSLPSNLNKVEEALRKVFGDERYNRLASAMSTIVRGLATAFFTIVGGAKQVVVYFKQLASSRLGEAFKQLIEVLRPIGEWMLDKIVLGIEKIAYADYSKIVEWAQVGLEFVIRKLTNIVEFAGGATDAVVGFFGRIRSNTPEEFFEGIAKGFRNLNAAFVQFVKEVASGEVVQRIAWFIRNLAQAIQEFVSRLTPAKILVAGFGTAMTAMFFNISAAFKAFAGVAGSIVGMVENLGGVFGALRDRIKPNRIQMIAGAIILLASALVIMSLVDSARLITATKAMVVLMAGLVVMTAAMAAIEKFLLKGDKLAGGLQQMSIALIVMAGAVAILAAAMVALSTIDNPTNLILPIIMVIGTMAALAVTMALLAKKAPELSANAIALVAMAVSIKIVVGAIKDLAGYSFGEMATSLLALVVVMGTLSLVAKAMGNVKIVNTIGLIALIFDLILVTKALKMLSDLNPETMIRGLIGMLGVVTAMIPLMLVTKLAGDHALKMGLAIVSVTAAMILLSVAVKQIGKLDAGSITKAMVAIVSMTLMFSLLAVASNTAGRNADKLGGTFLAMSAAILVLGVAIEYIGGLKLKTVIQGTIIVSALMGMFVLVELASQYAEKSTKSIVAMGVVIGLLMASIAVLTLIPFAEAMKSVAIMGSMLLAFGASMKLMEKIDFKVKSIVFMTAFLAEMLGIVLLLNAIKFNDGLIEKVGSMALLMVTLALTTNKLKVRTGDSKNLGKTLAFIGLFAGEAALIVTALSAIPSTDGLMAKTTALVAVMASMATFGDKLKVRTGDSKNLGKTLAFIGLFAAEAALVVAEINMIPLDEGLLVKTAALATVMGMMTLMGTMLKPMAKGTDWGQIFETLVMMGSMLAIAGVTILALNAIEINDGLLEKVAAISVLMGVMTGVIAVISAVSVGLIALAAGGIGMAISAVAVIDIFIADIIAMILLIGGVFELFPGLEGPLAKAEEIIPRIGKVLGGFAGSLLSALAETVAEGFGNTLVTIGEAFSNFATAIQPFLAAMAEVKQESLDGALKMTSIILALTGAAFLNGLTNFLPFVNSSTLEDIGVQLENFAPHFRSFAMSMDGIPVKEVQAAGECLSGLATLLTSLPSDGGIWGEMFGKKDFSSFGSSLESFADAFGKYCSVIKEAGITKSIVDVTSYACDALTKFANDVPSSGGRLQHFFGEKDISKFGTDLAWFASSLVVFYKTLRDGKIDYGIVKSATAAGEGLSKFANDIPSSGGRLQHFFGEKDVGEFGAQLIAFGEGLAGFFAIFAGEDGVVIDQKLVDMAVSAGDAFAKFAKALPNAGGFIQDVLGSKDLGNFGEQLTAFGAGLAGFFAEFRNAGITKGEADVASSLIDSLKNIIENISSDMIGAVVDAFDVSDTNESKKFYSFGEAIITGLHNGIMADRDTPVADMEKLGADIVSKFSDAVGVHSPSTKFKDIGTNLIAGLNIGIQNGKPALMSNMSSIGTAMIDKLKEILGIHSPSTVARDEVGANIIKGVAEGIESDTSAEDAAAQKAKDIISAFETELGKYSFDMNTLGLEFDLWNAKADRATTKEIQEKNVELLTYKLKAQAEKLAQATTEYKTTLKTLGAQAEKTQEAYNTFLQEQIDMISLANELISARQELLTMGPNDLDTAQLEYTLWGKLNTTATDQEKAQKELELIDKQLENHAHIVAYANARYQSLLESLGEEASATRTAYQEYLQAQIDMADAAGQFLELRSSNMNSGSFEQFHKWLSEMYDTLHDAGFANEEIYRAGYEINNWYPTNQLNSAASTVQGVMDDYISRIGDALGDIMDTAGQTATDVMAQFMSQTTSALSGVGEVDVVIQQTVQRAATGGGQAGTVMTGSMSTAIQSGMPNVDDVLTQGLGNTIQNAVNTVKNGGSSIGSTLIDTVSDAVRGGGDKTVEFIDSLFGGKERSNGKFNTTGYDLGNAASLGVADGVYDNESAIKGATQAVMETAAAAASTTGYSGMYNAGIYAAQGFMAGMSSGLRNVEATAATMAKASVKSTNNALGIHSPSRVFYQIGKYIDQGLANGITDEFRVVAGSLIDLNDRIVASGKDQLTIRPVFDDSHMSLEDFYGTVLQWDAAGTLVPYGYNDGSIGGRWLKVDREIAHAIRIGDAVLEAAAYRSAYQVKDVGYANPNNEEVRNAPTATPAAGSNTFIFNQTNTSPTALNPSLIYRKTETQFHRTVDKLNDMLSGKSKLTPGGSYAPGH